MSPPVRTSVMQALIEPIKKGNGTIKLTAGALVFIASLAAGYGKLADDVGDNSEAIREMKVEMREDLKDLRTELREELRDIKAALARETP